MGQAIHYIDTDSIEQKGFSIPDFHCICTHGYNPHLHYFRPQSQWLFWMSSENRTIIMKSKTGKQMFTLPSWKFQLAPRLEGERWSMMPTHTALGSGWWLQYGRGTNLDCPVSNPFASEIFLLKTYRFHSHYWQNLIYDCHTGWVIML